MTFDKFHPKRLIAALNKAGISVTPEQYWKEWDIAQTQAAVGIAGFSEEVENWIWEKDRKPFEMF